MPRPSAPLASRILTKSNVDATVLHDAEGSLDKPVATNERITPAEMTGVTGITGQSTDMVGEQERPTDAVPLSEPAVSELPPDVDIPEQLPMAQERTLVEDNKVLHRPPARERPIRTRNTMPDYGWLAESLWAKVERLKRYPPIARMNRWE